MQKKPEVEERKDFEDWLVKHCQINAHAWTMRGSAPSAQELAFEAWLYRGNMLAAREE